jgi:hypothetical protein
LIVAANAAIINDDKIDRETTQEKAILVALAVAFFLLIKDKMPLLFRQGHLLFAAENLQTQYLQGAKLGAVVVTQRTGMVPS